MKKVLFVFLCCLMVNVLSSELRVWFGGSTDYDSRAVITAKQSDGVLRVWKGGSTD